MYKICIDCRMWGRQYAGIGRYIQEIVSYLLLNKQWHFILLMNKMVSAELSEFIIKNKLDNVEIKICAAPLFSIKAQIELVRNIPLCDILWVPSINIPLLPTRAKKLITTIHDVFHLAHPEYYSKLKFCVLKSLITRAIKKSSLILTVSDFSADEIVRFYGEGVRGKIQRVYNGYNEVHYEKQHVFKEKQDYILFVGSVKPHKNLKNALLAFEKCQKEISDLHFVIVGKKEGFVTGDNEVEAIVNRINQGGEKVVFTGSVDDNTLFSIYEDASSFIMPSYYEGFGIPLVEAMYFKLPIICSDIPVFHEICGDQVLYFDPYDVDDIRKRIIEVNGLKHMEYSQWPGWYEVSVVVGNIIEKQF